MRKYQGIYGNTRADVTCHNFQLPGNIRLFFNSGVDIQTLKVSLNQSEVFIPISWVLLDYGSTVRIFFNAGLVDNIQDANAATTIHTDGVSKDYTQTASFHLFPLNVHFNSTSLANILSLSDVKSHYRVTMDTTVKSAFNVQINYHTIVKFLKYGLGMYYFDTAKSNKSPVNAYSFLSIIKDNKSYFS